MAVHVKPKGACLLQSQPARLKEKKKKLVEEEDFYSGFHLIRRRFIFKKKDEGERPEMIDPEHSPFC